MTIMHTLYKYAENYQAGRMVMLKCRWESFGYLVDISDLARLQIY
jgi:hypothetical protein